jgi:hypothetical protein
MLETSSICAGCGRSSATREQSRLRQISTLATARYRRRKLIVELNGPVPPNGETCGPSRTSAPRRYRLSRVPVPTAEQCVPDS